MATRPITVQFSASADARMVSIDRETTLVLCSTCGSGTALVSWDPGATIANAVTGPVAGLVNSTIAALTVGTGGTEYSGNLNIPLSAGEVIYVSRNAAGIVLLYFNDP